MADKETPESEWNSWMSPKEAVAQCSSMGERTAIASIYQRLCSGLIKSTARKSEIGKKITEYFPIDSSIWERAAEGLYANSVWYNSGDMAVSIMRPGTSYETAKLNLFGIRFDPAGINEIWPFTSPSRYVASGPTANSDDRRNLGGRPRKEFWDDLLIEMFRRIYLAELKPATQADLEKAMLDWASQNGHNLGETSVKKPARKLFNALKD